MKSYTHVLIVIHFKIAIYPMCARLLCFWLSYICNIMKCNWNYPQNWLGLRQYYLSMIELSVATHGHEPSLWEMGNVLWWTQCWGVLISDCDLWNTKIAKLLNFWHSHQLLYCIFEDWGPNTYPVSTGIRRGSFIHHCISLTTLRDSVPWYIS
jgi:hypothetical protein